MLIPIPGCLLLAAYHADETPTKQPPTPAPGMPALPSPSPAARRAALRLITVAVEVAAGRRPPRHLRPEHFSPAAVASVRRLLAVGRLRGGARVGSLHVRMAPGNGLEAHGTLEAAGAFVAYSAQLSDGQLRGFDLIR